MRVMPFEQYTIIDTTEDKFLAIASVSEEESVKLLGKPFRMFFNKEDDIEVIKETFVEMER